MSACRKRVRCRHAILGRVGSIAMAAWIAGCSAPTDAVPAGVVRGTIHRGDTPVAGASVSVGGSASSTGSDGRGAYCAPASAARLASGAPPDSIGAPDGARTASFRPPVSGANGGACKAAREPLRDCQAAATSTATASASKRRGRGALCIWMTVPRPLRLHHLAASALASASQGEVVENQRAPSRHPQNGCNSRPAAAPAPLPLVRRPAAGCE
jgi:hypothetical protein